MDSRYEHLDLDETGKLKGLWKVDVAQARGIGTHDFWGKCEEIIQAYTKLHPQEMVECLAHCAEQRERAYNEYGRNIMDKHSTMRTGIALPNGLLIKILTLDPEFLAPGDKLTKFRKLFPGFNTSKKI